MKITRVLAGSIATGVLAVATTLVAAPSARAQAFSLAALEQAKTELDATLTVPGTAFAVDRSTGRVKVQVDDTVTGAKLTQVQQVSAPGGAATITKISGKLTTEISGGNPIYGGGYVCSLGFNGVSGCAEGGDSGGALFAGTTALGLTSGGNGDCTTGGTTYFQPVTEALSAYGVSLL